MFHLLFWFVFGFVSRGSGCFRVLDFGFTVQGLGLTIWGLGH